MKTTKRFVSYVAEVEYIELKKCGCCSIKDAFLRSDGIEVPIEKLTDHPQWTNVPSDWRAKRVFTFIRHPLARLVSAYVQKLQAGLVPQIDRRCQLPATASFEQWVHWVCTQNPATCDGHWQPQSQTLKTLTDHGFRDGPLLYYRLEDIADIWPRLQLAARGLADIHRLNTTEHPPWRTYYTEQLARIAIAYYAEDMHLGSYHEHGRGAFL